MGGKFTTPNNVHHHYHNNYYSNHREGPEEYYYYSSYGDQTPTFLKLPQEKEIESYYSGERPVY